MSLILSDDETAALQAWLVSRGRDLGKFGPRHDGVDGDGGRLTRDAFRDELADYFPKPPLDHAVLPAGPETGTKPAAGAPAINARGLALIQYFESCLEPMGDGLFRAYADPYWGWKVPTIGWGSTYYPDGRKVQAGDVITQLEADALLAWEVGEKAREVRSLLRVPVTADQFAALVSFAYNVGSDIDDDDIAEGLGDSTLLKKLNRGDITGAADEFLKWVNANGQRSAGLVRRRKSERNLFLGNADYLVRA